MNQTVFPPALRALLADAMTGRCVGAHIEKNQLVFAQGEQPAWMFYVVSGEVILARSGAQGETVVLQRTRQGFVSEASLKVSHYHCDARAIADTVVIKVPIDALTDALARDPAFAGRWIDMLNSEVRRLRLHCERLSMKSVRQRLLHLIQTEGRAGHYPIPSGLKTLAAELAVSHEALYRGVAALEAKGQLVKTEGELILRD